MTATTATASRPAFPSPEQRMDLGRIPALPPVAVVLYVITVLLPVGFNLGPLAMSLTKLLLFVLIVPLLIRLFSGAYGRVYMTDILMILHTLWLVPALAVNNPGTFIQSAGSTGIEFLGGYLLGRAYIRSAGELIALIKILVLAALLTLPFALYETATGNAILLNLLDKLPGLSALQDISTEPRMGLNRVQLTFSHPIHYGLFCTIIFSLCYVGLKGVYSSAYRITLAGVILASGALSLSSGALLAIVLQLAIIMWAAIFNSTKRRWVILLGILVFFYVLIDLLSNRTPIRVFMSYATFSPATAYWRAIIFEYGMQNVWANPVFGLGMNEWVRPSYMYSGSVDNFWLLMAMRYGIPGFVFLAAAYLIALWKIGRRDFDDDILMWQVRRAWMFSFAGLTFTLATVHIWGPIYSFVFFVFGAGIWMLEAVPQSNGEPAEETEHQGKVRWARREARTPRFSRFPPKGTSQPLPLNS